MEKENGIEESPIFKEVPSVTIVNKEESSYLEEAVIVDQNGHVDPISLEYNEYRDRLAKRYGSSTEEDAMISSFYVQEGKCVHTLSVRFADGKKPKSEQRIFDYTNDFKNDFLIPMVEDYTSHNQVFGSSLEVIDNKQCNFIIRTSKNDSLCISNIDIEFANRLSDLLPRQEISVSGNKQLVKLNAKGIGNYLVILLTIIAIGMTLVGTIFFTIASRK